MSTPRTGWPPTVRSVASSFPGIVPGSAGRHFTPAAKV
jgi:hypothetical protein